MNATNDDRDDRLWFEVPTGPGLVQVRVPREMSAADANEAGERIRAILRAMFAVVDSDPMRISDESQE